ncbi:squalene/phytoene synthase family protein [Psychromarinibacter halotolerans]|uniref:Squalene/phytoene synthase family protein n=1 Tax=Psychromarinibacter halotolerans TaxID=1775175 RepID=A0ABV7GP83_9RHOB|nr:squalene/phytoene synthase family protein [Psychromarinibacter halotolerans]MDF0594482.1 squalene/phytoene synthase family protein [Psychromarinibacter halotolerans]
MSLQACADLVRKGDPDRFLAAMAAPPAARRVLFPLYAFNVEVSRAPWLTSESMIAEMRLQWWRDVLEEIRAGGAVRRHEVVDALVPVLDAEGAALLDDLIEARRWDIYTEPFEDDAAFARHIEASSANLFRVAARALDPDADAAAVAARGWAAGLANWFLAVPELEARGRMPLPDGRPEAVRRWAQEGLRRLGEGRVSRGARPAVLAAWRAKGVLRRAVADPGRVAAGALPESEFRKRVSLMWKTFGG